MFRSDRHERGHEPRCEISAVAQTGDEPYQTKQTRVILAGMFGDNLIKRWLGRGAARGALALAVSACTDMTVASDLASLANVAPSYVLYSGDGRGLWESDSALQLKMRAPNINDARVAAKLYPLQGDSLQDNSSVVIRIAEARYVSLKNGQPTLETSSASATVWRVMRTAGSGALALGELFSLSAEDGSLLAEDDAGKLIATFDRNLASQWALGCDLEVGPYGSEWSETTSFEVATEERADEVSRAAAWLVGSQRNVQLPMGDLPLIVWDDPTLSPEPTVAYLMTDTLWAAKALRPYDPDLADALQTTLVALGWYGNGLADTLFHGLPEPAHRAVSTDVVHGTLLGNCVGPEPSTMSRAVVQLRVPEVEIDPSWTAGNSAQFIDSAMYTALNDFWNGEAASAISRVRDAIEDSRNDSSDLMFWDDGLKMLVDQASRSEFDSFIRQCSSQCVGCMPCASDGCGFEVGSLKLGLLLYAARVMGLDSDAILAPKLAAMADRLWEGQRPDGGIPHALLYGADGSYRGNGGATGEATAIAILANTLVR